MLVLGGEEAQKWNSNMSFVTYSLEKVMEEIEATV